MIVIIIRTTIWTFFINVFISIIIVNLIIVSSDIAVTTTTGISHITISNLFRMIKLLLF